MPHAKYYFVSKESGLHHKIQLGPNPIGDPVPFAKYYFVLKESSLNHEK